MANDPMQAFKDRLRGDRAGLVRQREEISLDRDILDRKIRDLDQTIEGIDIVLGVVKRPVNPLAGDVTPRRSQRSTEDVSAASERKKEVDFLRDAIMAELKNAGRPLTGHELLSAIEPRWPFNHKLIPTRVGANCRQLELAGYILGDGTVWMYVPEEHSHRAPIADEEEESSGEQLTLNMPSPRNDEA